MYYQNRDERVDLERIWLKQSDKDRNEVALRPFDAEQKYVRAELYHQKYRLRRKEFLWNSLLDLFQSEQHLVESEMATKLSGFVNGFGSEQVYEKYMKIYGLSPVKQEHIAHERQMAKLYADD